jgi:crossover junction endodeoxyribonuclease RuvC
MEDHPMPAAAPETTPGSPSRSTVPGRVVGIDPGLNVTGYAVVDRVERRSLVREAGVIRGGSADVSMGRRLRTIHDGVLEVIDTYHPAAMALEQVHSRPAHPRTAILMAHARGVIVLAASLRGIPVVGYAPSRIKKGLTGSGRAPKEQVQQAVKTELGLEHVPEPHDVADAIAVALCHLQIEANRRGLAGLS